MNALMMPNFAQSYAQGREAYQQNALRQAMQQYGAAAMQGDQNALAQIAQFDPQLGMQLMKGQQDMKLADRQDNRAERGFDLDTRRAEHGMSIDTQRLELAREEGRRSASEHGMRMQAFEREQALAEATQGGQAASVAYQGGEEQWNRFLQAPGIPDDLKGVSYEEAPYMIALLTGVTEGLTGGGEQFTLGEGQTRFDASGNPIASGQPKAPDPTDDMREYKAAQEQGFQGTLQEWLAANRQRNVTVPAPQAGYRYIYDDAGNPVSAEPIPGTPAAREAELSEQAFQSQSGRRDTATSTIQTAAKAARDLIGATSTGIVGQIAGNIGQSNAAEVQRQVEVLRSNATIENLQAMRSSSPTGAGLGSITQQENQMLATASGALDPSAGPERFKKALDNYERTLLRIVHGPEEGDRIFAATREDGAQKTSSGVQWRLID